MLQQICQQAQLNAKLENGLLFDQEDSARNTLGKILLQGDSITESRLGAESCVATKIMRG